MIGEDPSAAYRVAPRVAVVEGSPGDGAPAPVYVAPLPDGPISVLEAAAAVIWRAATSAVGAHWVEVAAAEMGGTGAEAGDDIRRFADELVARGLLLPTDTEGGGP